MGRIIPFSHRPTPPPPSLAVPLRGWYWLFIAQVPAGQRNEDVFQADLPRRQARERAIELGQQIQERWDCQVRLADRQGVPVALRPACKHAG
jgi:hypothetical protein